MTRADLSLTGKPRSGLRHRPWLVNVDPVKIATIDRFSAAIFRKNANRHADGRRFQTLQHVEDWSRHRENAGVIGIVRLDTLATRRSEDQTSEHQSLMRISSSVFCFNYK